VLLVLACGEAAPSAPAVPPPPPEVMALERAGTDVAALCALVAQYPGTPSATEATSRLTHAQDEARAAFERAAGPRGLDPMLLSALSATFAGTPCGPRLSLEVALEPDASPSWSTALEGGGSWSTALAQAPEGAALRSAIATSVSERLAALIGDDVATTDAGGPVHLVLTLRAEPTGTIVSEAGPTYPTFELVPVLTAARGIEGGPALSLAPSRSQELGMLRSLSRPVGEGIGEVLRQLGATMPLEVVRGLRIAEMDEAFAALPRLLHLEGAVVRDGCGGQVVFPACDAALDPVTGTMEVAALHRSYGASIATDGSGALIADGSAIAPGTCPGSRVGETWILEPSAEGAGFSGTLTGTWTLPPSCERCTVTFAITATP
jgi:hypothetical protein